MPFFDDNNTVEEAAGETMDVVGKAVVTAGVGAAAFEYMRPGVDATLLGPVGRYLGQQPVYVIGAVTGAATSVASDLIFDMVLPFAEKTISIDQPAPMIQRGIAAGMGSVAVQSLLDDRLLTSGVLRTIATGAAIELAGNLVYTTALKPMLYGDK